MPFCERKKDVKNSVCVVYYENMVLYYVVDFLCITALLAKNHKTK